MPSPTTRPLVFLHRHLTSSTASIGPLFIGAGVGLAAGILLRMHWLPWVLPQQATPIFSSFAGALVGAGAAGFWARHALMRGDAEACRTVASAIRPVADGTLDLLELLKATDVSAAAVKLQLDLLKRECQRATRRLGLLTSLHAQMREGKGIAIADAQIAIEDLSESLDNAMVSITGELTKTQVPKAPGSDRIELGRTFWKAGMAESFDPSRRSLLDALVRVGHPREPVRVTYASSGSTTPSAL